MQGILPGCAASVPPASVHILQELQVAKPDCYMLVATLHGEFACARCLALVRVSAGTVTTALHASLCTNTPSCTSCLLACKW